MTSSDRRRPRGPRRARGALPRLLRTAAWGLVLCGICSGRVALGADVRIGGTVGFGIGAVEPPGAFTWDFGAPPEDTTLAVLHLGARAASLAGFVALGARLAEESDGNGLRFELREAALTDSHRRANGDSLGLRLFTREPQSLWIDHALTPPVAPGAAGGADATGARADVAAGAATATLLVGWRSALFAPEPDLVRATWKVPADDYLVLRLRGDALRWAGLRLGGTWKRFHPVAFAAPASPAENVRHTDVVGLDARAFWRGVQASIEYEHTVSEPLAAPAPGTDLPTAGNRSAGPLTRMLGEGDGLRAELRSPGLALGRWGAVGFAPQVRALGNAVSDPLADAERDRGWPRRGLEGYRLEAWYTPVAWPGWLRYAYDRHQQFRDADRRIIAQTIEWQAQLTSRVQARGLYVQRDEELVAASTRVHHDDLLAELVADDVGVHARFQAGIVEVGAPTSRPVAGLEAAAHLGQHMQVVTRTAFAADHAGLRRSLWLELQYWHLPQFEFAVQYGPEWIGDATDPVLDVDLTAAGASLDRFQLHFQGWF